MLLEVNMLYFLFFMLGAFTFKLFGELLSVINGYQVFKFVERYAVALIAELEVYRHQAIQILELSYGEAGEDEEFDKIKAKINEKFDLLHTAMITVVKNRLPYKVDYSNLKDAIKIVVEEKKDE